MWAGVQRFVSTSSVLRGMLFMLLSTLCGSSANAFIRGLSVDLHPFEVTFFRSLFGFLFLMPIVIRMGWAPVRTRRYGLFAVRGLIAGASMLMFFLGVSMVPLAKVAALNFTAPLFATVMAVLLLGERIRLRRVTALVAGFSGALIILRPGLGTMDTGSLILLGAAALFSVVMILVKILGRTESSLTVTLWGTFYILPVTAMAAIPVWTTPRLEQVPIMAALGILATCSQWSFIQALKDADLTATTPIAFTRLLWSALIGFLFFAEVPDLWTWVGGTVIFAAGAYIAFRERKVKERSSRVVGVTPPTA